MDQNKEKPWQGRFSGETSRLVEEFTSSLDFDRRLYRYDIAGSMAHARMLGKQGILTQVEVNEIVSGLEAVRGEIDRGEFEFEAADEDIHMAVERRLTVLIGEVGRKLHTARSRNDQVALDIRLYLRDQVRELLEALQDLRRAGAKLARRYFGVILPGYTHLQRAQPVLATHYWLAYCEKFERDRERLADCRRRVNQLPLGAAALAGTTIPIDRRMVAQELSFEGLLANSLDASSDRDFVLEFTFCLAMIAEHLSGWAEEWILWSTTEFGFLKLPQAFCTGSSIMPQKINPDVLELIRGKTGRVIGSLTTLLILVKGLPLAYNRDLQEDKQPLFDATDTVRASLALAAPLVAGAELQRDTIAACLDRGYLDATTLMEHLILMGVPQRTAHEIIGRLVGAAMKRGVALAELPLTELRAAHSALDERAYAVLGAEQAVAAFTSYGSTNPAQVAHQLDHWRQQLAQDI